MYLYNMQFDKIINARIKNESDRPQMKKDLFPVSERLQKYLNQYGRDIALPVAYKDLSQLPPHRGAGIKKVNSRTGKRPSTT